jgi:hypothetical protein
MSPLGYPSAQIASMPHADIEEIANATFLLSVAIVARQAREHVPEHRLRIFGSA